MKRHTSGRLSVVEYLDLPATMTPTELVYGVVREPPAPQYGHQRVVTHLGALLDDHVRSRGLGEVCVSPVDVVLDAVRALVLQPDIVFLASPVEHLMDGRIWGGPDLVVEILSPGTAQRDRTTKLRWYREHGVRECWIVDPIRETVEVVRLAAPVARRTFTGRSRVRSAVLADWDVTASQIFE